MTPGQPMRALHSSISGCSRHMGFVSLPFLAQLSVSSRQAPPKRRPRKSPTVQNGSHLVQPDVLSKSHCPGLVILVSDSLVSFPINCSFFLLSHFLDGLCFFLSCWVSYFPIVSFSLSLVSFCQTRSNNIVVSSWFCCIASSFGQVSYFSHLHLIQPSHWCDGFISTRPRPKTSSPSPIISNNLVSRLLM